MASQDITRKIAYNLQHFEYLLVYCLAESTISIVCVLYYVVTSTGTDLFME